MLDIEIIERMYPGQLMQHYLMASYSYYLLDESPMTDLAFDRLCELLLVELPTLVHQHKHLVTDADLTAGTCLLAEGQYPRMAADAVNRYAYVALCQSYQMHTMLEPHLKPVRTAPVRPTRVSRTPLAATARPQRVARTKAPVAPATSPPTVQRITRTRR